MGFKTFFTATASPGGARQITKNNNYGFRSIYFVLEYWIQLAKVAAESPLRNRIYCKDLFATARFPQLLLESRLNLIPPFFKKWVYSKKQRICPRWRFAPPSEINTIGRHLGRFASALAILLPDSIGGGRKSRAHRDTNEFRLKLPLVCCACSVCCTRIGVLAYWCRPQPCGLSPWGASPL